jgi:chromosome condensin MukBEF ATPase and DNA-binding subunit MukB
MEEWKEIQEFPNYEVSSLGRVASKNYMRTQERLLLQPYLAKRGYYVVSLHKDKKQYNKTIHRLLALAFLPNPENLPCIDHINRVRTDNRLENLRWTTDKQNKQNRENKSGHLYIYPTKCETFRLHIRHLKVQKRYKTLEEALEARDALITLA